MDELQDYGNPRCSVCNSQIDLMFTDGEGIHAMYRFCPVCDGKHAEDVRVYCSVTVRAGTRELAEEMVLGALTTVGRLARAEAG
jgi:hypothetical protein